jgi:hypothetical protein
MAATSIVTPPNYTTHAPITARAGLGAIAGQDMVGIAQGFFQAGANGTFDAQVALNTAGAATATLKGGFDGSWLALQMIG